MVWFHSSPSSLMHIETHPQRPRKVSTLILDVDADNVKVLCQQIIDCKEAQLNALYKSYTLIFYTALSKYKLEPEFLLSVDDSKTFDVEAVKIKGTHTEVIKRRSSFTASVLEGFTKAHFTVMAVSWS